MFIDEVHDYQSFIKNNFYLLGSQYNIIQEQFHVKNSILDILAYNQLEERLVIIELKNPKASYKAIAQIVRYYQYLKDSQLDNYIISRVPECLLVAPAFSSKNQNILNTYLNNNKLLKKKNSLDFTLNNKKRTKSFVTNLNISSNNPSTYETSFNNSIFDLKSPQLKNINISNILQNKVLVHLRPKSDYNKIKLDIILGYAYFISKENQNQNKKKIEKFIFKTQKNFDEKIKIFMQNNSEKKVDVKNNKKSSNENKNINTVNQEIKNIAKIFHKFENIMTIYGLIIYYLLKAKKEKEAKIIYLLIIKQNMRHIKYLEEIINFKELLTDKFGKYKLKIYDNFIPANTQNVALEYLEMEPLKLACQHFVNCCATGQKARSDGANGYEVVSILEEAERIMLGSKVEELNKKDFALSRMKG